ncbi:MAG: OmpA family protein [Bacteroidia bacterium]|nr:OmpA family protein [Bacteroidia bacterium]
MKKIIFLLLGLGFLVQKIHAQTEPKFENLGKGINSEYDELAPVVTPDGKTLYFTRKNHPQNQSGINGTEDTWVSSFDPNTKNWSPATNLGKSFNSQRINGIQSISPDGNSIFIFGAYEKGAYKGLGFSIRERTPEGWGPPSALNIEGLTDMVKGIYLGGYLANSGKTLLLYFSELPGSRSNDLYISFQKEDGAWTRPKNLGPTVNSSSSDASPFIAADNKTLYFASDREGGLGSFDIYVTRRLDDSWLTWSKPENLGPSVNTPGFEANYSIPASGEYAYIATEKGSAGRSDLARIKLDKNAQPDPVALVFGTVKIAETNIPVGAAIRIIGLPGNTDEGGVRAYTANGKYQTTIPVGKSFLLVASKAGFKSDTAKIDLVGIKDYKEINHDFTLVQDTEKPAETESDKAGGLDTRLSTVYFESGKIDILPEAKRELDRVYTILTENPDLMLVIEGNADIVGTFDDNWQLSEYRARNVRAYLIAKGVSPSRLKTLYFGNTNAASSNRSEEGRKLNRRVDIHIWIEQF